MFFSLDAFLCKHCAFVFIIIFVSPSLIFRYSRFIYFVCWIKELYKRSAYSIYLDSMGCYFSVFACDSCPVCAFSSCDYFYKLFNFSLALIDTDVTHEPDIAPL